MKIKRKQLDAVDCSPKQGYSEFRGKRTVISQIISMIKRNLIAAKYIRKYICAKSIQCPTVSMLGPCFWIIYPHKKIRLKLQMAYT